MSIETALQAEVEDKLVNLASMEAGSEEYKNAVDGVTKLMDRVIEIEKLEMSENQNKAQMEENRKSRLTKNVIDIGSIVLPLVVTIWGARTTFRFEENGTITTAVGRKFIDKLISRK